MFRASELYNSIHGEELTWLLSGKAGRNACSPAFHWPLYGDHLQGARRGMPASYLNGISFILTKESLAGEANNSENIKLLDL